MLLPWDIWSRLFKQFGRSEVTAVKSPEDVAGYCSKYVTKRMSEYGFYGHPVMWDKNT